MGAFSDLRLSFRRAVLIAALLGVSTFATVAGAQASTSTHFPFIAEFGNPCTGELVAAEGFQHLKIYAEGELFHLEFNLQDVKGTVLLTGARYVAKEQTSAMVNDIPPGMVVNVETIFHLIRQKEEDGTFVFGDDFKVKMQTQFVINANGVPKVTNPPEVTPLSEACQ